MDVEEDHISLSLVPTNLAEWMTELNEDLERLKRDLETVVKHKSKLYKQLMRVLQSHREQENTQKDAQEEASSNEDSPWKKTQRADKPVNLYGGQPSKRY